MIGRKKRGMKKLRKRGMILKTLVEIVSRVWRIETILWIDDGVVNITDYVCLVAGDNGELTSLFRFQ